MPKKSKSKDAQEQDAPASSEPAPTVPEGFNEETFQVKATKGRKFPTNFFSRILFHDATKRLSPLNPHTHTPHTMRLCAAAAVFCCPQCRSH